MDSTPSTGTDMPERKHNERNDDRWHLRKEVHIGHLFMTLSFIFAGISLYINLDRRIDRNAIINEYQDKALQQQSETFAELGLDVKEIRKLLFEEYKNRK